MNGGHFRQPSSAGYAATQGIGLPPTKVLLDGYRGDLMNPINETPRYNPLNASRPRSSALLNINDPVAMHLLMETAVGDSLDFEVLSFEEVEEMKKEYSILSNRIEATKKKLALESKLRDAAQSLNRLYSTRQGGGRPSTATPDSPKKHRRSLLGSRGSDSDVVTKTDDELAASTRKCEELAQELWRLEKRAQELQKRLLHHTAGILQMTHKGFRKDGPRELPRSPESMRHESMPTIDAIDDFDDRSFYREPDHLDDIGNGFEKRESRKPGEFAQQSKLIRDTETRLEDLNNRLREMILQANPNQKIDLAPKAVSNGDQAQSSPLLKVHLDYLEHSLEAMDSSQTHALQDLEKSMFDTEERLEDLNIQLHSMIKNSGAKDSNVQPPPNATGRSLPSQISYLGVGLDSIEQQLEEMETQKSILKTQIQQQRDLNSKSDSQKDAAFADLSKDLSETKMKLDHTEREHRGARDELTLVMERLDAARQESTLREQQWSQDESSALKAEKEARRELEASLVADLKAKEEEIDGLDTKIHQLMDESEVTRMEAQNRIEALELRGSAQQMELQQTKDAYQKAERELQELESEVVRLQTEMTMARAELEGAYGSKSQRAADVAANPAIQREISDLNERNTALLQELEALKLEYSEQSEDLFAIKGGHLKEIASLKNQHSQEADTLRATHAEQMRALEVSLEAQAPEHEEGSGPLQDKIKILKGELTETIQEYEELTRSNVEFEREREQLEGQIDSLRERCEALETQLSDEKVRWLGMKSPGTIGREGGTSETTSTMVLKNEFKKMMRDTRAENMKSLKAEQEERRRLEALVRSLKKEQQLGKSGLSQSMTAS